LGVFVEDAKERDEANRKFEYVHRIYLASPP